MPLSATIERPSNLKKFQAAAAPPFFAFSLWHQMSDEMQTSDGLDFLIAHGPKPT